MKKMWLVALLCIGSCLIGFSQSEKFVNKEEVEETEELKIAEEEEDKMEPRDRFMINLTFDNLFHKENNGFKTKWHSRGIGLYYMYDIPIKNSRVSIAPGLGFSHSSYYHNSFMVEDSTGTDFNPIVNYDDQDDLKKHKLAVNYVEIPVELRFFGKPSKKGNVFKLALGFRSSVRLVAVNKETNRDNGYFKKVKTKGYRDVALFKGGPTLRIGYAGFNIIAFYSVTELFKKNQGPAMTPFSIGISITGL
tara:strand:- start:208 stop:954 length:747 start_codon:yes stop_codon:yes gene_type:complete